MEKRPHKRLRWLAIFGLLMMHQTAISSSAPIEKFEIVEYGIYTSDYQNCKRDAQGINRCDRTNVRHAATTKTIPAQLGVQFGMRFRVIGPNAGEVVQLKRYWVLPPPGMKAPGSNDPISRLERNDQVTIGQTGFISYTFDDAWELVPGTWKLEYWDGTNKLASVDFTVVK